MVHTDAHWTVYVVLQITLTFDLLILQLLSRGMSVIVKLGLLITDYLSVTVLSQLSFLQFQDLQQWTSNIEMMLGKLCYIWTFYNLTQSQALTAHSDRHDSHVTLNYDPLTSKYNRNFYNYCMEHAQQISPFYRLPLLAQLAELCKLNSWSKYISINLKFTQYGVEYDIQKQTDWYIQEEHMKRSKNTKLASNPWVVKLSWHENAYSRPVLSTGDLDQESR